MNYHWLNKNNNENLIIFFCGWSFDYKPFEVLKSDNYDVITFYDYSDIGNSDFNELFTKNYANLFSNYKSVNLIAWSMGVYAAYLLKNELPEFDCKIAINGTPFPVNDDFGIPVKTFDLTLKYVDTGLQGKFQKNLFKKNEDYQKYLKTPVSRNIENQKNELISLNNFIKNRSCEYNLYYDKAIISDTDKIIPTRNQINFWTDKAEIVSLNSGHFPFYQFSEWKELLTCK